MKKNLLICGLSGSGKSTLVEKLAERLKMKPLFASKAFREFQKQDTNSEGWWENNGMKFTRQRLNNLSGDKAFDRHLMNALSKGGFVTDSWTMPWLMEKEKRVAVWLEASPECRAKRVAKRNKQLFEEALAKIREKEELSKRIYFQAYGIKVGEDFKPFDMVLNVEKMNERQVLETVAAYARAVLKK